MSPGTATPADRRTVRGTRARRLDPLLDPAIGLGAALLALTSFLTSDVGQIDPRLHGPNVLGGLATVVAAGSLAWRRSRPRTSYVVFLAGSLVVSGSGHYIGLLSVLLLLSLYSLTTQATQRDAAIGLGAGAACFAGLKLAGVPDLRTKDLLLALALLVAAWAVGEVVRTRREVQRDQVRSAITEERLRIARELHDVVAHSMALIAVQAGVGAHLIRTDPTAAGQALDVIAEASRRALEQTRSMLGMLREEDEDGLRPPTQGLDDLPDLVEDVRVAGLDVDLAASGTPPGLDAVVSLTTYRIVQESLTNVIKHSAAATASVTVGARGQELDIEVRDPGPTRATARAGSSGHGLVGLDERVRLVGGTLTYGAVGDGFCVHATPAHQGRPVITVAVVDDQDLVRAGFVLLLRSSVGIEVVGEARNGLEAIALCRRTAPDVVLMDVRMPHLDGIAATRTILADPACAPTRVLVLTTFDEDELVLEALRSGASGFLLKETRPEQLLEAIEVVAAGEALLHPRVTRRLIERFAALPVGRDPAEDDGLTDREREVLRTVAQGLSNSEIAAQLHLGYGTVKTHVSHLLTKLDLRDRAQLVMYAYESGLVVPGGR